MQKKYLSITFITLILTIFLTIPAFSEGFIKGKVKLPFEPSIEMKNKDISIKSKSDLVINFKVDDGSYIYKDSLSVKVDNINGIKFGNPVYPKPEKKMDKFSNHEKEIYSKSFSIKIPVEITDKTKLGKLEVKSIVGFQGCSLKQGICFIPQKKNISTTFEVKKK